MTRCSTCGSEANCSCRAPRAQSLGAPLCADEVNQASCCQNSAPSAPLPFYACAPACPEDHTKKITIQQFYTTVKITESWNVPDCGETAVVTAISLKSAAIGSYLWNATYGYYEIIAFDDGTGQVTLLNHCNTGNAAAGTAVDACSEFIVTDPPPPDIPENTPCVAIDFTAPDVGNCIDITLTATTGLTVNGLVQIGSGIYRVDAIKPNDIITICNDGDGITPGTSVIARDAAGNYQYCLGIISSNVCDNAVVLNGTVMVCNAGTQSPLSSECITGGGHLMTVVALDAVGSAVNAQYRAIDASERLCTCLTSALAITNGDATYTIAVDDVTGFQIGDPLNIELRGEVFTITNIGASTIDVTAVPTPGADGTVNTGSWVCLQTCCDQLSALSSLSGNVTLTTGTGTINNGSPTLAGASTPVVTITNSTTKTIHVLMVFSISLTANATNCNTSPANVEVGGLFNVNGGGFLPVADANLYLFTKTDGSTPTILNGGGTFSVTVAPGATSIIAAKVASSCIMPGASALGSTVIAGLVSYLATAL